MSKDKAKKATAKANKKHKKCKPAAVSQLESALREEKAMDDARAVACGKRIAELELTKREALDEIVALRQVVNLRDETIAMYSARLDKLSKYVAAEHAIHNMGLDIDDLYRFVHLEVDTELLNA